MPGVMDLAGIITQRIAWGRNLINGGFGIEVNMSKDVTEWLVKTRYERDQFVQNTGLCYLCRQEKATYSGRCPKCEAEGMMALKVVTDELRAKGLIT